MNAILKGNKDNIVGDDEHAPLLPILYFQAAFVYEEISSSGVHPHHLGLDRQLTFYNDLFGWSRIAFQALTDHAPPDTLFGPSVEGD